MKRGFLFMKDVKLEKKSEKVFTKRKVSNVIKNNHNFFNKYCSFYKKEGLKLEESKIILEELKQHLNWKSKIFVNIFPKMSITLYRKGMADCFNYYNKNGTF